MNVLVEEWVTKAEEDFSAANLAIEAIVPLPSVAAFHSQQCAEKYLKAYLTEHDIEFKPRHPLLPLRDLIEDFDPDIDDLTDDLDLISDYAVDVRYPGRGATLDEATEALAAATRVRAFIRSRLGLDRPTESSPD
ncbi:MAG: HEPN domain-containing protein [Chloroflexi bacterium]|nr:HEPN domain-containing protein [Chloroflexota bacterium]MBI3760866.1 HEPN domain-containing protein [Chloroflexota bacterium]